MGVHCDNVSNTASELTHRPIVNIDVQIGEHHSAAIKQGAGDHNYKSVNTWFMTRDLDTLPSVQLFVTAFQSGKNSRKCAQCQLFHYWSSRQIWSPFLLEDRNKELSIMRWVGNKHLLLSTVFYVVVEELNEWAKINGKKQSSLNIMTQR